MTKATISVTMESDGGNSPTVTTPSSDDGIVCVTVCVPVGTSIKLEVKNPRENKSQTMFDPVGGL